MFSRKPRGFVYRCTGRNQIARSWNVEVWRRADLFQKKGINEIKKNCITPLVRSIVYLNVKPYMDSFRIKVRTEDW